MSLFSRLAKVALASFILFALALVAPGTWSTHDAGSWLSATPAWAGSPDETLNPPPTPSKSRYAPGISVQAYDPAAGTTSTQVTRTGVGYGIRWTDQLAFVWRFYLASVLRI
jgi:hypothetical protein